MTRRKKFCLPSQNITPAMSLLLLYGIQLNSLFPRNCKIEDPSPELLSILYIVSSPLQSNNNNTYIPTRRKSSSCN